MEHNRVKQALFGLAKMYMPNARHVLDLACGRGGDLGKIARIFPGASYTGVDSAEQAIEELCRRASEMSLVVKAIVADASTVRVEPGAYAVVSMNFALHYFCDSRDTLASLMSNISCAMEKGGIFIGTCVDYRHLMCTYATDNCIDLRYGKIQDLDQHPWGQKYHFVLPGCVDNPEYVVHMPSVVQVAHEYGLHLVKLRGFNAFIQSATHICPECPESNALYCVFAFVKDSGGPQAALTHA